jgi:hypothetical protein
MHLSGLLSLDADSSDTAQLTLIIRGVNSESDVTEEMAVLQDI